MGARVDRDVVVGILAIAIAAVYWHFTMDVQDSLLSDAIGARGLPRGYAIVLAVLGLLIALQGALRHRAAAARAGAAKPAVRADLRSLGLLLFGIAYLALINALGYIVTIMLVLVGVALYVGARFRPSLVVIAGGGALVLWATFAKLFELDLPIGSLWSRFL